MTGLIRLLRSSALRSALIYFGLFAAAAAIAVAYIFWKTNVLLVSNLEDAVQTEIHALDERYRIGGADQLRREIAARSETPGNSLYLVATAEGKYLAGNLKEVSPELSGPVMFVYRRPAGAGSEERLAFANIFRLANGYRLVVGRDIEDQREFGRTVRQAFLWTLAGMALLGLGGGILLSRNLLRRIDNITATSRTIMAGNLSRRIPVSGTNDEFDRLAANLNAMLRRIAELVDGFREVSDNIAHDLKTPLSRLRNRVEAALREGGGNGSSESYRETLQATIEDADDLIKTFDALLSIARLEAGAASGAKARFSLNAVIDGVCELYEPVAEEGGMALKHVPAPETPVEGERQLVAQAIANIVDNAIKYGAPASIPAKIDAQAPASRCDQTSIAAPASRCDQTSIAAPAGGEAAGARPEITVAMVANGRYVDIVVADRGPGVPVEDRERVLKRFVRLEASRSRPGSGLGLSLAAAVARLHGGRLALADNDPGLKVVLTLRRGSAQEEAE